MSNRCLDGIRIVSSFWKESGRYQDGLRMVSRRCLEGVWNRSPHQKERTCMLCVWKLSGRCLEGVWNVSGKCLEDVWMVCDGLNQMRSL